MKLKIDGKEFNLLAASADMEMLAGYRRDVITLKVESSFAEMDDVFVDGATFSIIETVDVEGVPTEQVHEQTDHTVAGPITDNRDGTISVKMGKTNTKEQDLEQEAQKANAVIEQIAGEPISSPESVTVVRNTLEAGADTLSDQEAIKMPSLSKHWTVGEAVKQNNRRYYEPTKLLYKCVKDHTTQADWTPDKTPAMWVVIDNTHTGGADDPIPASRGMEYEYGKYYLDPEDQKTYICKRTGEPDGGKIVLQFLPHELIGQYFEAA